MMNNSQSNRVVEALTERLEKVEGELHALREETASRGSMRAKGLRRLGGRLQGRPLVTSVAALAILAAPVAIAAGTGDPLLLSKRNPSSGSASGETEIIADNTTYGTRQSNKKEGDGGGAIYGCRSDTGKEPCVRGNNLRAGRAFEFETDGSEAGYIEANGTDAKPFTTNATGVATGLNADRLDDKEAADFVAKSDSLWAVVDAGGALARGGGATSSSRTGVGTYDVDFNRDITTCALVASIGDTGSAVPSLGAATTAHGGGIGAGNRVLVYTYSSVGVAADRSFHLIVECST